MSDGGDRSRTRAWRRLLGLYDATVVVLAGLLMLAVVVVMSAQVFYRYALNDSLIWAEEVCRYALVAMTFLLAGAAYRRGDMIGVGFVVDALPRRARAWINAPVRIAMIAFLLVTAWYGYRFAQFNGNFSAPAVDFILTRLAGREVRGALSMYWLYLLIPIGCVVLAAHIAVTLRRAFRALDAPADAEQQPGARAGGEGG